ncbi:cell death regulator Aven-like [Mya arenaria]|uniref:cell death regulator Aven-like n=1 Tax=Mya arenaria TaxID=6604 RepID=UPI0022E48382|nr:cell death regulator Aven-like [Mya arenaria]
MRPDEHKKRKNAQYKQKHNISDESKFKSNNSSKKDVKSANLDCKEELKRETKVTYEPSGSEEVVKQYRRKQLESNWSRYTEISSSDDDDLPTKRGEDFNKLFAQAGGSAAQFRFKDEKDWDHDQGSANVGTLNLDLHGLIKSLDCIPMHQRLGIDEGLFSQDQMCEILSYSSKNQEKYDKQKRQQKTAQPTVVVSSNGKHANGKQLKANAKKVNSKDHRKQNSIEPEANNKIRVTNASRDEVIGTKNYMSLSKPPDVKKLEDDLDALLGLSDTNCAIHEEHHTESADENTHKREDVKNAQTMSPDKPCDTGVVKKKVSVSENGAPVKKGDNLEDWLDDFLDD